jgi:SpoVK/Ycf46/Vps4 family AAA+-type ATPase
VALVPAKGAKPGVKSGDAPRLAAGIADRQFDLKTPNAHRGNPFAQLPPWLQKMVKLSPPGENVDLQLMARQLAALDEGMLKRLGDQRFTFDVTRYRVTNARNDLADVSLDDGSGKKELAERASGVTTFDGDNPSIAVRTYFVDGQLRTDVSTLLAGIGIAFDQATRPPLHDEKDLAAAFDKEKEFLPKDEQNKLQFFAQTFALYMLDRVRCKRQFPLAFAALDKRFASMRPDGEKLLELERGYDRPAIVNLEDGKDDLRNVLAFAAKQNQLFRDAGVPGRPLVVHLDAKDDWGAREYVEDAARHMRNAFGKDAGVYKSGENFVAIAPGTFNSADEMDKLLTEIETSGRATVLYVDATQIGRGSAGFNVIEERVRDGRDVPPLVLTGDSATLAGFEGEMPSVLRMNAKLDALTSSQQVERVKRRAAQDGFLLMKGVTDVLEKKLKGGGYQDADDAWASLKRAQFERLLSSADESTSLTTVREISLADASAMKVKIVQSPQERLAAMIGQDEAKRQFDAIVKRAKVSAMKAKEGVPESTPPRLNLLFSGSPGTGKTTFAEILGALLKDVGAIKNPVVTKVTIQDLLAGSPEAAVKALFEQNKGGVIFLDEMHQLQDTAEGKRAFRAMIPYLADPAYQDTVFIGAGYSDELGSLLRDVDPGAERRFTTVPFLDYSKKELATILDAKAKAQNLVLGDEARDAALNFLEYRRRTTKNFGNAGEIDIALAHAQKAQVLRVADLPPDKITKRALMELLPEDFAIPAPITKEQFWQEMDAMTGWDDVKARLKSMGASIEGAVRRGKQPTDAVEPYWIVDGPPGTGKSTLARMLAKFGAAYGLTAVPEVVDVQGAGFQGEYVGQTAGVVKKQFEKAWGRLMFVDEVSGLAKSGGTFKDEATKIILAETENNRGKFMMVVADYAENINLFLGLDPGLPRRFGNRITLQPWPADQAAADCKAKLASEGVTTTKALDAALTKQFAKLAKTPGYASGGDVRTIKNAIVAALDAGETDLAKAVDAAFADLIEKKQKDSAGKKP